MHSALRHSPRNWFATGVYPSCSCGYDPRDNLALNEHWREHGITWHEDHGRLIAEEI